MQNSQPNNDELLAFRDKWQITVNLLAKYLEVPSALVMHVAESEIEVFVASNAKENPYKAKQKLNLGKGHYYESLLKNGKILNIPNALKDEKWKDNPAIDLNLISFLGLPIFCSDKNAFGIICVLDHKERHFDTEQIDLLKQFKYLIEADINICAKSKKDADKNITILSENAIKAKQINKQLIEERNIFTKGNVVVFKWKNGGAWPVEYVSQNVA
ncbi:MAG: hypothetical protein DRJ10_13810, partial [Bacteroidetes bacterium]